MQRVVFTFQRNVRTATGSSVGEQWWSLKMRDNSTAGEVLEADSGLHTFLACDRTPTNALTASLGVTGPLAFFVLVYGVFRTVRGCTAGSRYRLRCDELPDTRDLVDLCDGVYIARRQRNLEREADLFDEVIRLFRSPEALLKLTGEYLKVD
jgi:hypothetical protein